MSYHHVEYMTNNSDISSSRPAPWIHDSLRPGGSLFATETRRPGLKPPTRCRWVKIP